MDNLWFWMQLAFQVGVAWFETWAEWLQGLTLFVVACALVWLVWMSAVMAYRWLFVRPRHGLTLVQKQAMDQALESPEVK